MSDLQMRLVLLALLLPVVAHARPSAEVAAGDRYRRGDGIHVDLAAAAAHFQRACEQGDPAGCMRLADMRHTGEGMPADVELAAQAWLRACDLGDPEGCVEAGSWPDGPIGHLLALRERACDAGSAQGCDSAAALTHSEARRARATDLWRAACEVGDAEACRALGARPGENQDERINQLEREGCKRGDAEACLTLRLVLPWENGAESAEALASRARAITLLESSCASKVAASCARLASIDLDAEHAAWNVRWSRAACELGDGLSCNTVADSDRNDPSNTARLQRATRYDRLGCAARYMWSCAQLATDASNPRDAAKFRLRACELGEGFSCLRIADELPATDPTRPSLIEAARRTGVSRGVLWITPDDSGFIPDK